MQRKLKVDYIQMVHGMLINSNSDSSLLKSDVLQCVSHAKN